MTILRVSGGADAILVNSVFEEYEMSVSRTPASTTINIDEFERRVRAPGDPQAAEDPLAEFMRFVQSFGPPDGVFQAPDTLSRPGRTDRLPTRPLTATPLQPSTVAATQGRIGTAPPEVEASAPLEVEDWASDTVEPSTPAKDRWRHVPTPKAAAIAVAGAGLLIAAGFGLTTGLGLTTAAPGLVKARSLARAPDLAPASQPSHDIIAASVIAKATPLKAVAEAAPAETTASVERRAEPDAPVSLGDRFGTPALASAPAGGEPQQPATQASAEPAPAATVNAPVVAAPVAAPSPATSQSPVPSRVPAASLPEATPSATGPLASAGSGKAPQASDALKSRPDTAAVEPPPTAKPDLPVKPLRRSSARLVVAKAEATAPGADAEPGNRPPLPAAASIVAPPAPAEPAPQAATALSPATPTTPQAPLAAVTQPVTHVFRSIFGALGAPGAPAAKPVDLTAAAKSGDWAVQFAAPKSEAKARLDARRLNAKFATALNGATIGVHKTALNGDTVYALRVAGLSKADAAALCERVKGHDCSLAK